MASNIVAAWLSGALSAALAAGAARAATNVVVIVSDDLGYRELTVTGGSEYITPNFERLASEGASFECAYVASPACSPSRAGFVTGLYPHRFGYERNIATNDGLTGDTVTLFDRFLAAGYRTGAIGKWHLGAVQHVSRPLDQGVEEFFGFFHGNRPYFQGASIFGQIMRRGNLDVEDVWPTEGDATLYDPVQGRYVTDAFGEEAELFIRAGSTDPRPFFLYVAFNAPHAPLAAKQQDLAVFPHLSGDKQVRAAGVYALDRAVGRILNTLDDLDLADETLVIFFNDNGAVSNSDNLPFAGRKGTVLEGGVRVPAFMRGPDVPRSVLFRHPASTLDMAATALAAAGIVAAPSEVEGGDLRPYFNEIVPGAPQEYIYLRFGQLWGILRENWKLVVHKRGQPPRLHDLDVDITEAVDLSSMHPEIVNELTLEFSKWEASVRKPLWGETGAEDRNNFDHFRFAHACVGGPWSESFAWQGETGLVFTTMLTEDAYANCVLEFPLGACAYTTNNDMTRMSGLDYMLNELRFTGSPSSGLAATIEGLPLVFTATLDGASPRIRLGAVGGANASVLVRTPIRLLSSLVIEGDGPGALVIESPLEEFQPGLGIAKTGAHSVTTAGVVRCTGPVEIVEGSWRVTGPTASMVGPSTIRVGLGASLLADSGGTLESKGLVEVDGALNLEGAEFQSDGSLVITSQAQVDVHQSANVAVGGDFDAAITEPADFRWHGPLQLGGDKPSTMEAMSRDIGPNPAAFEAGEPGRFPLGSLTIRPGAPVSLIDRHVNDSRGVALGEAVYVRSLMVPPGALLVTNGIRVYCQDCVIDGAVDEPSHIVQVTCLGDLTGDGAVNFSDLNLLLSNFHQSGAGVPGDLNGDHLVNFADLNVLLNVYGIQCMNRS